MTIILVAAMDERRVIGFQGQMPWHLPADLKHFKRITMGKPIIMGRKTYESIGRPLPGRRNIVLSQKPQYHIPGCEVMPSLHAALTVLCNEPEVMIIGGGELFKAALPLADRLYLTIIEHRFVGDTEFPDWNKNTWHRQQCIQYPPDQYNPYAYRFETWLNGMAK